MRKESVLAAILAMVLCSEIVYASSDDYRRGSYNGMLNPHARFGFASGTLGQNGFYRSGSLSAKREPYELADDVDEIVREVRRNPLRFHKGAPFGKRAYDLSEFQGENANNII